MAKFCGNCGAMMDDNDVVCGNCGVRAGGSAAGTEDAETQSLGGKKYTKKIIGVIVIALAVVVIIGGVKIVSKYTGYNGLLRKVMAAYEDYDIDELVSLSSDAYYYGNEKFTGMMYEPIIGEVLDSLENSVGPNYKLSYEVKDIYPLAERKEKTLIDELEYRCPEYDASAISKIMIAEVRITAKKDKQSASRKANVIMVKEDGKWKLLFIGYNIA